jgi:hypothetical protein
VSVLLSEVIKNLKIDGGKDNKMLDLLDICVPLVFAKTGNIKAYKESVLKFPAVYCDVKCKDVYITSRAVAMDCNQLLVCLNYNAEYIFIPVNGERFTKTFKSQVVIKVPKDHFRTATGSHINTFDFLNGAGTFIKVKKIDFHNVGCKPQSKNQQPETLVKTVFKFVFEVKMFRDHNIQVPGMDSRPVERLPIETAHCNVPPAMLTPANNVKSVAEKKEL